MIVLRLILTVVFVIAAVFGGVYIWENIFEDPWTRDAHVRADIVQIAPQVSGPLVGVPLTNNAFVKAGDLLLQIEQTDFTLALQEAQANYDVAEANAAKARQQATRLDELKAKGSISVADVDIDNANLTAAAADAQVKQAEAALNRAKVDLDRTTVHAPVSGRVTNLFADVGDFATAGVPVLAVVDSSSFRVDAYFIETKLARIRIGAPARIRLMANREVLRGRVQGIAAGIEVREDSSASLLQAPDPSFQWVRLAQRVPVEIELVDVPANLPLVNGLTATVIVATPGDEAPWWRRVVSEVRAIIGLPPRADEETMPVTAPPPPAADEPEWSRATAAPTAAATAGSPVEAPVKSERSPDK